MYKLAERAVLMRLSCGLPGKSRKDRTLTEEVKSEHALGRQSGAWIKQKFPDWALQPLEQVVNAARGYHAVVTLPFDSGIGILPAALIMEYGDKMRQFKGEFEHLRDSHFAAKYPDMVEWARHEHNGTFDAADYPEVSELLEQFSFKTEPLPVPDAAHFAGTMASLLGTDADSVNLRVQDAMVEAQKELMRRLIEPVSAMANKLAESPKNGKTDIVFRDTLIGNIIQIVELAPKLNIAGDPRIDAFVKEMEALTRYSPESLRKDKVTRSEAASSAQAMLKRLEGYKL